MDEFEGGDDRPLIEEHRIAEAGAEMRESAPEMEPMPYEVIPRFAVQTLVVAAPGRHVRRVALEELSGWTSPAAGYGQFRMLQVCRFLR